MTWTIKIPVVDPGAPLTIDTVREAVSMLDGDDALVTEQILLRFLANRTVFKNMRVVLDGMATLDRRELKMVLDVNRQRAGLESTAMAEAGERVEQAMQDNRRRGPRETRVVISPSGAIIEVDDAEAARNANADATLAERRRADEAEREIEAAATAEHRVAVDSARHNELPSHLR